MRCCTTASSATSDRPAAIREALARQDAGFAGPLTVYGERSRLMPATLDRERITFKQVPYHIKAWT